MQNFTKLDNKIVVSMPSTELVLIEIPAGSYRMGSGRGGPGERPQHEVNFSAPFYMGETVVTQAQWRDVAGLPVVATEIDPNPSYFKGDDLPVECVSFYDCKEFVARLAAYTGLAIALPSEAQWEYSCRAGTTTEYNTGSTLTEKDANFSGSGINKTTAVKTYKPNAFGLYDMHGNVLEWCADFYHSSYIGAPTDGSPWVE